MNNSVEFKDAACISQNLKAIIHTGVNWKSNNLDPRQEEAIEMILHRLARIVSGSSNEVGHWADIEAYAHLVSKYICVGNTSKT